MTKPVANLTLGDTFTSLMAKVNEISYLVSTKVVTADSVPSNTAGQTYLNGKIAANAVYSIESFSGGAMITNSSSLPEIVSANLIVSSNVSFTGNAVVATATYTFSNTTTFSKTATFNANLASNGALSSFGSNNTTFSGNIVTYSGNNVVVSSNSLSIASNNFNISGNAIFTISNTSGANGQYLGLSNNHLSYISPPTIVDSVSNTSIIAIASANSVRTAYQAALSAYANAITYLNDNVNAYSVLGYAPVNKAGDTMQGDLVLTSSNLLQNTAAGNTTYLVTQRSGKTRWQIGGSSNAESGNNAGTDLVINRFNDSGTLIDTPFRISRSNGAITSNGNIVWHAGNDGSGSGLDADLWAGHYFADYLNQAVRSSDSPTFNGLTITGKLNATSNTASVIANSNTNLSVFEVVSSTNSSGFSTGAALFSLNRPKTRGAYFGLDTDNKIKIGGWSYGNNAYEVWHAGNDGTGSGLDADLLDGQEGSYYANVIARIGYTPANKNGDKITGDYVFDSASIVSNTSPGGFTLWQHKRNSVLRWIMGAENSNETGNNVGTDFFINRYDDSGNFLSTSLNISRKTGILYSNGGAVWHSNNDGSGSGLDADLLDGQEGSYYANVIARIGYTPVNKAGDTINGNLTTTGMIDATTVGVATTGGIRLRANTASNIAYFQVTDSLAYAEYGYMSFFSDGNWKWKNNTVWHAGNDGSGSGLDADTVDGLHASDLTGTTGSNGNGYWRRCPDGTIEQWGRVSGSFGEGTFSHTFPIQFTDMNSIAINITAIGNGSTNNDMWVQMYTNNTSSFTGVMQAASGQSLPIYGYHWHAIGR